MKSIVIIIYCSWVLPFVVFGQENKVLEQRLLQVNKNYAQASIANVISGKAYSLKYLFAINSQFYNNSYPKEGSLTFEGVYFPVIEIQYDLYIQKVIVLQKTKNASRYVSIDSERVSSFSIEDSDFKYVKGDSVIEKGIYEIGFDGENSEVLIKRLKNKKEKTIDGKNVIVFSPENKFYIKNGNGSFHVTNKKSLYAAYQNEGAVKALIKKNNIKVSKKMLEKGIVQVVVLMDKGSKNSN